MEFGLSESQEALKHTARQFLAQHASAADVRAVFAQEDGFSRQLYRRMAELGWTAMLVGEQYGGLGLSVLDMALVLEEAGYAALPGPFVFSALLATCALVEGGSPSAKEAWLGSLAKAAAIGTVALSGEGPGLELNALTARRAPDGGGSLLSGTRKFVPYAHVADFIVAVAGRVEENGAPALFLVETKSPGLRVHLVSQMDLTRRVCRVAFDDVAVPVEAELRPGPALLERLLDLGALAIAADSLGGTERVLEMAVEYSKVRRQFGRPVGSFQALQHAAAEIVADLEPARALLWYAAHVADATPESFGRAAAMAKALLSEVFSRAAQRSVLMHGGIGFTWEHDLHIWFKRARFNESCFGSPAHHRERVARIAGY